MPNYHELSALARDAFVILHGACEIQYRDGDTWRPEEQGGDHPLVARLRAQPGLHVALAADYELRVDVSFPK